MKFKVVGGTPKGGGASACASCRNAIIIKGINREEVVNCKKLSERTTNSNIRFQVVECTEYDNKSLPSISDMYDTAWIIKSRNRGPIGFAGTNAEIVIEPPDPNKQQNTPATEYAVPVGETIW